MAQISQVQVGTTPYDVGISSGAEFIRGTWTAATNAWTGVTKDQELYDGKEILLFLPFGGNSTATTLNLTLKGGASGAGTTGAKNVYFNSTTRHTTHYGQYQMVRMTYHTALNIGGTNYEGWWMDYARDTDSHYTTHLYAGDGTAANVATTNGNTKLSVTDNSTVRNSVTIKGTGATTVTSDANGVITINSTDTNTNTDTKVTQTNTTASANYRLILSETADDTTRTEGARKSGNFYANPNTGLFRATKYNVADKVTLEFNATLNCLDVKFS